MHAARQLEEAFVAAIDGTSTAGANTRRWQLTEWPEAALPSLEVRCVRDRLEARSDESQDRVAEIHVIARAKAVAGCEDVLYAAQAEVFAAIETDAPLDVLVKDTRLVEVAMEIEQADMELGRAVMVFEVDYQVGREDLETIIP